MINTIKSIVTTIVHIVKKQKLLLSALLLLSLLLYSFVEPYWISTDWVEFKHPDIPESFDGFRIVFLSDIHAGKHFSRTRIEDLVRKVNALSPDIVVLGGDYTNGDTQTIPWCFDALGKINAPYGMWGVLGNHDNSGSGTLTKKTMNKYNIHILDNASTWLYRKGARIKIGGVGDLLTDVQKPKTVVSDVKPDDFVIMLSHNPDYAEMLSTSLVDLMLSGHTHGGQVTLFGVFAPILPTITEQKYRSGLAQGPKCMVYTTNGLGTIPPHVRFFAPPQISVITLRSIAQTKK